MAKPRTAGRDWNLRDFVERYNAESKQEVLRGRVEKGIPMKARLQVGKVVERKEGVRIIGHPDLGPKDRVQSGDTLYVSVAEAIYRERRGEVVELHLTPTPEDEEAVAELRQRARSR